VRRIAFSAREESGIAEPRWQWASLRPIHQHRAGVPINMRCPHIVAAVHLHAATCNEQITPRISFLISNDTWARHYMLPYVRFFKSMVKYMMELSSRCSILRLDAFCNRHPSKWLCTYGLMASISVRPRLNPNCNQNNTNNIFLSFMIQKCILIILLREVMGDILFYFDALLNTRRMK